MTGIWYVEVVLSGASGWQDRVDELLPALEPVSGTLGQGPGECLSVRVSVDAPDAIKAVQAACVPVMDALLSAGLHAVVIESTEVLTEAEMDAFLASPGGAGKMIDPQELVLHVDLFEPEAREWMEALKALVLSAAGEPWLRMVSSTSVIDMENAGNLRLDRALERAAGSADPFTQG